MSCNTPTTTETPILLQNNSPLAKTDATSSGNNTASGIPFIKSRGRTVPKPFILSSSKKRDISQVASTDSSSEGKKVAAVDPSSKKLKPTLPKTNSGVPFIKKKEATICEPPKFLTTAKREATKKQQPVQKKPAEKTPFSVEEDLVESVMKDIHNEHFKKDVTADIEKVKVPVDVLITKLNHKLDELKNTYLFSVQLVDVSVLKNFCRQHSKKFEIAQDREKNQKIVRLKKPSVLKTVNTIVNKPLKSVLISSIKTVVQSSIETHNTPVTPIQTPIRIEETEVIVEQQQEEVPIETEQVIVEQATEQQLELQPEAVSSSQPACSPETETNEQVTLTTSTTVTEEVTDITPIQGQN